MVPGTGGDSVVLPSWAPRPSGEAEPRSVGFSLGDRPPSEGARSPKPTGLVPSARHIQAKNHKVRWGGFSSFPITSFFFFFFPFLSFSKKAHVCCRLCAKSKDPK